MIVLLVHPDGRPQLQDGVHEHIPFRLPVLQPVSMAWRHPFEGDRPLPMEYLDYTDCRCLDRTGRPVWTVGGVRPEPHIGERLGLLKRTDPAYADVWVSELAIAASHIEPFELAWLAAQGALRKLTGAQSLLRLSVRHDPKRDTPHERRGYRVEAEGLLPYIVRIDSRSCGRVAAREEP